MLKEILYEWYSNQETLASAIQKLFFFSNYGVQKDRIILF